MNIALWYIRDIGTTKIFVVYEIFFFKKFCFDLFNDSVKHILKLVQVLENISRNLHVRILKDFVFSVV
jgi:hypothetical protein